MTKEELLKDFYNKKLTSYISWPTYRRLAEDYFNNSLPNGEDSNVSTNKGAKEVCPECGSNNVGLIADWKTRVCFECKHNWHTGHT